MFAGDHRVIGPSSLLTFLDLLKWYWARRVCLYFQDEPPVAAGRGADDLTHHEGDDLMVGMLTSRSIQRALLR